ncbi:hypothetical protein [Desulfocurvus sp. DL9XJH121]
MYEHKVKVHGQYLAKAQDMPQNASAAGNGAVVRLGGTMGGIEIEAKVVEALALADTKVASIIVEHSSDGSSFSTLGTLYSVTAAGAITVAAGTVLGRMVLPTDCKDFVRCTLTTDDEAADGSVSVYPTYLPR